MRPELLPMMVLSFLMNFCLGVGSLAIPELILDLGGKTADLGYLGGIPAFFYVCACLIFGRLGDRIAPWKILIPAALGYGLFNFPVLLVAFNAAPAEKGLLLVLYLFLPLCSICQGFFWPPFERYLAEGMNIRNLTAVLQAFNVSWCSGLTLGTLCYGPLKQYLGRPVPFAVMIACGFISVIWIARFHRRPLVLRNSSTDRVSLNSEMDVDHTPAVRRSYLVSARIANFACYFVAAAALALYPELAKSKGIDSIWLSIIVMTRGALEVLLFFIMGLTHRFYYRPVFLPVALLVCLAGTWALATGESIEMFILGFSLIGLATGVTYPSAITYSLDGHDDKAAKGGIHEAILGTGFIIGPLICGYAGAMLGLRAPYWTAGMVTSILLLSLFFLPGTRGIYGGRR